MATISSGSVTITIQPGEQYRFIAGGEAYLDIGGGSTESYRLINGSSERLLGGFIVATPVTIRVVSGSVDYINVSGTGDSVALSLAQSSRTDINGMVASTESGDLFGPNGYISALTTLIGDSTVKLNALVSAGGAAPTYTQGSTEFFGTGITNFVTVPWTDARFRYDLCRVLDTNTGSVSYATARLEARSIAPFASNRPLAVEFEWTGTVFAFGTRTNNALWRMWIDGVPLIDDPVALSYVGNNDRQVRITFGSRARRRIRIEGTNQFHFRGLAIEPTAVLHKISTKTGPKVAWMTDSFGEGGSLGITYLKSYVIRASRLMGWGAIDMTECVGSTGFVNPATGGKYNYAAPERIASLVAGNPDIVVVQGSRNDSAYTGQISANVVAALTAIRQALPGAWIVVTGPLYMEAPPAAGLTIASEVRAGYDTVFENPGVFNSAKRVAFIQTTNPSIATGTGNSSSPAGDGSADYLLGSDDTHPTVEGYAALERYFAAELISLIPRNIS